jgi:hypothetical protein
MNDEQRNVEYWNIGQTQEEKLFSDPLFHYSFHRSNRFSTLYIV